MFQEYFAAQFIDSSELLFNPDYQAPQDPHANHYAIELKWQGVYFLWLNRDDVVDDEKDALLKTLISLENICGGFYYYRAYFLAARSLREFKQSQYATEILRQVVRWSFDQFDEASKPTVFPTRQAEEATKTLDDTDTQRAVAVLEEYFWTARTDPHLQCSIASKLGSLKQGRPFAIRELARLMRSSNPFVCSKAAVFLYDLEPHHPNLMGVLSRLLGPDNNEAIRLSSASLLQNIDSPYRMQAIETLRQLAKDADDEEVQEFAMFALWDLEDSTKISRLSTVDSHQKISDDSVPSPLPSLADILEQLNYYPISSPEARKVVQALIELLFNENIVDILADKKIAIELIQILKQQCVDLNNDPYSCHFEPLDSFILLHRFAAIVPFSVFHEAWHTGRNVLPVTSFP